MTFLKIHTAYISIGMGACLCYIYYNDLVQEDIKIALINNEKKISNMQEHIISGLANLIESRDTDTGEHITRTCKYVKKISERAMQKGIYKEEKPKSQARDWAFLFMGISLCRKKFDELLYGCMDAFEILSTGCGKVRLTAASTLDEFSCLADVLAHIYAICNDTI